MSIFGWAFFLLILRVAFRRWDLVEHGAAQDA
jgi:hypothetical protein